MVFDLDDAPVSVDHRYDGLGLAWRHLTLRYGRQERGGGRHGIGRAVVELAARDLGPR